MGRRRLDLTSPGQGQPAGSCENGNELTGVIKFGDYLDQLRNYKTLKKILLHEISCVLLKDTLSGLGYMCVKW